MDNAFFGRDAILEDLAALWRKRVPSFVTCRGRRRIGKTTLIERFAQVSGARLVKIEGLKPKAGLSNDDELAHFAKQLHLQTGAEETKPPHSRPWCCWMKCRGWRTTTRLLPER